MIFVTGGTGMVGIRILYDLISTNKKVIALKRNYSDVSHTQRAFDFYDPANGKEKYSKIEWVNGDVCDVVSLRNGMRGCSEVYHAAALVSFKKKDRDELAEVNVQGTANVVNVSLELGVKKFCHISSVAALGRLASNELTNENSEWSSDEKTNNYSVSKYFAEMEVWRGVEESLNAVILCPSLIVGAGNPDMSSALLYKQTWKGMKYYGPGKNAIVDVRTISTSAIQLMNKEVWGERFIVSAENLSYKDIFTKMAKSLGKSPPIKLAKNWQLNFISKVCAIFARLGFSMSVSPENMSSAQALYAYDNRKLKEALALNYPNVDDSIDYFSRYYLELFEGSV